MAMTNCPRCGKIFDQLKSPICSNCAKDEEAMFRLVKEYIEENKAATVAEVSQETGVSVKRIQKFLKDGRIQATPGMSGFLKCSKCGADILGGRLCAKCIAKTGSQLDSILHSNKESKGSGPRMHTKG